MRNAATILLALVAAPIALAAPCTSPTPLFAVRISPQSSSTPPGSVRLRYDAAYLGYAPQFGVPTLSVTPGSIEITQPVIDTADAGQLTAPPGATSFCDAEDVELGPLAAGTYGVVVRHSVTVGGVLQGLRWAGVAGFVWTAGGTVQCSTTRSFLLIPPAPGIGSPVSVRSTVLARGSFGGTSFQVNGNAIDVSDFVSTEFPAVYTPYCLTSEVNLGSLPPGSYTVNWNVNDFGVPRPELSGTFQFVVSAAAAPIPAFGVWILVLLAIALALMGAFALR